MRILSKLILARERQPLAESTWAVTSPSSRKRPHLKLPNDETSGQGKAVLRAFQDTDVKGVMLSLVRDDCQ